MKQADMNDYYPVRIKHLLMLAFFSLIICLIDFQNYILNTFFYTISFLIVPGFLLLYLIFDSKIKLLKIWIYAPVISISIIQFYSFILLISHIEQTKLLILTIQFSIYFFLFFCLISKNQLNKSIFSIQKSIKIKKIFQNNTFLMVIYLLLIAIFLSVRFPLTFSDDPWFHLLSSLKIIKNSYNNLYEYRGLFGFFLIIANNVIITNINPVLIIKWVQLFSIPYGGLIIYCIANDLNKLKQIPIILTSVIVITPLGFCLSINQLWPTMYSLFQGLILLIFFIEIKVSKDEKITRPYYILTGFLSFFMIITHDATSFAFLLSFLFLISLEMVERKKVNKKLIKDMIFYSLLLLNFFIYQQLNAPFFFIKLIKLDQIFFKIPIYLIPIGIVLFAYLGKIVLNYLSKETFFEQSESNIFIYEDNIWVKFIKKYLIKIYMIACTILPIIIFIVMDIKFKFYTSSVIGIVLMGCIVGLFIINYIISFAIIRRKDLIHRIHIRNSIFYIICIILLIIVDFLFKNYFWWIRFTLIFAPHLALISFKLYDELLTQKIFFKKFKSILLIFSLISIGGGLIYEQNLTEYKTESELTLSEYFPPNSDNEGVIFTGFRWMFNIQYYSKNFTNNITTDLLINPNFHSVNDSIVFSNIENISNIYVLLDDYQLNRGIYGIDDRLYAKMDKSLQDEYYNLYYFNRICVSGNAMIYWYNQIEN